MKNNSQVIRQYSLAELTQGLDVTLRGDPACVITGVAPIQQAQAGKLAFLMSALYKKYLPKTQASAVILSAEDAEKCPTNAIITSNPYYVYARIARFFDDRPVQVSGIHATAVIGDQCHIDPSVRIGAHAVIGNRVVLHKNVCISPGCVIDDDCVIEADSQLDANVTIYHRCSVGKRATIASGTVIGSDGFGVARHADGWLKVPQLGRVVIGDDVEIGANCTIDRGAIEDTVIARGAKLDNLIQVAHNVRIGENTAIAGCVGIAGSAVIGKNCLIGGGAGISGHISIADGVMITGMTALTRSIHKPGIYSSGVGGVITNAEWRKISARIHRIEHWVDKLKALEMMVTNLTERKST